MDKSILNNNFLAKIYFLKKYYYKTTVFIALNDNLTIILYCQILDSLPLRFVPAENDKKTSL